MSGIYGARLAQKSSRISQEESAYATGDVDERAFRPLHPKRKRQEETERWGGGREGGMNREQR